MPFGVSAPMSTRPPGVVSFECMILSASAGSSLAWKSAYVFISRSPPKTER
jgi:hypothetical protein